VLSLVSFVIDVTTPSEIRKPVISLIAIQVSSHTSFWARFNKRLQDSNVDPDNQSSTIDVRVESVVTMSVDKQLHELFPTFVPHATVITH
jgi:hypothetical protein